MAETEFGAAPTEGRFGVLWELLFPSRCLGCGRRGVVLCADCRPTVPWLPAAVCPRCALKTTAGGRCRRCERGGSVYLALFLAQVLAESLAPRPLEADPVIPVPLSPGRRRQRAASASAPGGRPDERRQPGAGD